MTAEPGRGGQPYPGIEAMIRATGAAMTRVAYGVLRSYPDADDAVQTAFVNVHKTWATVGRLPTAARQRAYLRRAVLNESYRIWSERRARREVPAEQTADPWIVEWDAAGQLAAQIDLCKVWRAVDDLPDACGEVMSLFIAGYEYGEIAKMVGISVSAVRSHVSNGRRRLRAVLPDVWEED
jgi:RNA polymerase sigma-70 factor (ECF subfamily)